MAECTAAQPQSRPKKILFVGNSYVGGVKAAVRQLLRKEEPGVEVAFVNPGGYQLIKHSQRPDTLNIIRSRKWDVVVLQDQSQTPSVMKKTFMEGAGKLVKIVEESGASVCFYMTWGRRDGDKRNPDAHPTYDAMQKRLTEAYCEAGRKFNARVAPVGIAWSHVRRKNNQLFRELYRGDGSHPSPTGALLAAYVFHATLFNADPTKLEYTGKVDAANAAILKQVAKKAVGEMGR